MTALFSAIWKLMDVIAAFPKIVEIIGAISAAIFTWYASRSNTGAAREISDGLALAMRAKTSEDRYNAAEKIRTALLRPRIVG